MIDLAILSDFRNLLSPRSPSNKQARRKGICPSVDQAEKRVYAASFFPNGAYEPGNNAWVFDVNSHQNGFQPAQNPLAFSIDHAPEALAFASRTFIQPPEIGTGEIYLYAMSRHLIVDNGSQTGVQNVFIGSHHSHNNFSDYVASGPGGAPATFGNWTLATLNADPPATIYNYDITGANFIEHTINISGINGIAPSNVALTGIAASAFYVDTFITVAVNVDNQNNLVLGLIPNLQFGVNTITVTRTGTGEVLDTEIVDFSSDFTYVRTFETQVVPGATLSITTNNSQLVSNTLYSGDLVNVMPSFKASVLVS